MGASSFIASPRSAAIFTSLLISARVKLPAKALVRICWRNRFSVAKFLPVETLRMSTMVSPFRPKRWPIRSASDAAARPAAATKLFSAFMA